MNRIMHAACLLMLSISLLPQTAHGEEGEWKSIFDGKTLEGWDGDPEFWSVEDGAITGTTTADHKVKTNTFCIWTGGETGDFELKLEYKLVGGNSGIQYRSFQLDPKGNKWRIGGYQGDFEAGDKYSGILYGEQFRGILANRGQKTELVINDAGKFQVKVTGSVGDSKEIQSKIKKEDWNKYHIIAKGYTFKHFINGVQTIECTDNDEKARRDRGLLALQLHQGFVMKVQFRNIMIKGDTTKKSADAGSSETTTTTAETPSKKKIVFLAGGRSHGFGSHDHKAGCYLLADELEKSGLPVECVVSYPGWPKDMSVFEGADAIVIFSDGGGGHPMLRNLKDMKEMMDKGVGLGCIHYAVEVPRGSGGQAMLDWTGGYFETKWSVNPHWTMTEPELNKDHPITRGVKPFSTNDEWYYHMRFRANMEGVSPILSAHPPKETVTGRWKQGSPDGDHNGNQFVYKEVVEDNQIQHLMWALQRTKENGGGRGFGVTGSHYHWNWADDNYRKLVLNAIVWIAGLDVPKDGVPSKTPTVDELLQNHDENVPDNFDKAGLQKRIDEMNGRSSSNTTAPTGNTVAVPSNSKIKPAFQSVTVNTDFPCHCVPVSADITGAKELYLVVNDAGDGIGCDWAAWIEPRLIDKDGNETKLTELKWKQAISGHGNVNINKNSAGKTIRVGGAIYEGIGTHANSVIAYDLPKGHNYVKFVGKGGLDEGGTEQGCGSTVQFLVYTQAPPTAVAARKSGDKGEPQGGHDAGEAVTNLDVNDDLQVDLFAAEPMLLSPSNIDIDHKGRVWVCEIVNYRRNNGKRPEGDRILIFEDTDGDGKADGEPKVFHQGRDIDSAHGVTVLGTPDGKNTHVIVSVGDKVLVFVDKDGDDKADESYPLFTGISGTQHDHGIHQFIFGPDGKLYFNFGNAGHQIKDKDGNPIIDKAGNEVKTDGKPYYDGLVFRCNLDGSEFETLGWNFRNNWMVTVDSFGTLWQSDNDDDGNRGVRINYVMEFGNYGYKDEVTGEGWTIGWKKANSKTKIPDDQKYVYHWHQLDPGVVPNMLNTGAGSPTGICIYEGSLLPKRFVGSPIHSDAGPNVVRAYLTKKDGAGYSATIENILVGARDKWFRPSDVKVAPDGSLIVADWYDPGVGGHGMRDLDHGRLFRVSPKGTKGYKAPEYKFDSVENCIEALKSPTPSARYVAWSALHRMGNKAKAALTAMAGDSNPIFRARAVWLLGKIEGNEFDAINLAAKDKDADIRCIAIRLVRQLDPAKFSTLAVAKGLSKDDSPQVRREVAIAIRQVDGASNEAIADSIWADLATQYDGKDRWYLEALGLASDLRPESCFAAYLKKVPDPTKTQAGREIVWRIRAKAALPLLVKIVQDKNLTDEERLHYMRAFDFHPKSAEKDAALLELLE